MSDNDQNTNQNENFQDVAQENQIQPDEPQQQYEDREALTNPKYNANAKTKKPLFVNMAGFVNRKRILVIISCIFVAVFLLGTLFSISNERAADQDQGGPSFVVAPPRDFLRSEMTRSFENRFTEQETDYQQFNEMDLNDLFFPHEMFVPQNIVHVQPPPQFQHHPPPPPPQQAHQQAAQQPQPQYSPLIPNVEGFFIARQAGHNGFQIQNTPSTTTASVGRPMAADDIARLMTVGHDNAPDLTNLLASLTGTANQDSPRDAFHDSRNMSTDFISGSFLPENTLWVGSIIPAVLTTAINTDVPGNITARVTQNVFDSGTGRSLLIPQGSFLIGTYNSSTEHGLNRIQISWDIMIRPDGFQIDLGGMNAVDRRGMAGIRAIYRENWFEYLKAAGIISVFSIINASMVDQVARFGNEEIALGVLTANQEFIRDIGGNLVSRAVNIRPTLRIDAGERINIMTNRNIFLPPVERFPVTERHVLR